MKKKRKTEFYRAAAKSQCVCGHSGDGELSLHGPLMGHGPCLVLGCGCEKFTWKRWLPWFEEIMKGK